MGLGIKHIHTTHVINHLETVIENIASENFTGALYCTSSLKSLILEAGMGHDVLKTPFERLQFLTTHLVTKCLWQFLSNTKLNWYIIPFCTLIGWAMHL
jgi:hypothetical protein